MNWSDGLLNNWLDTRIVLRIWWDLNRVRDFRYLYFRPASNPVLGVTSAISYAQPKPEVLLDTRRTSGVVYDVCWF